MLINKKLRIGYTSSNMNSNIIWKDHALKISVSIDFPFERTHFILFKFYIFSSYAGVLPQYENWKKLRYGLNTVGHGWDWCYHKSLKLTRGRKRAIAKGKYVIFYCVTILLKLLNFINYCHWLMLSLCLTSSVFIWTLAVKDWGFTTSNFKYWIY